MRKSGLLLPAQLFLETRPRPKGWGFFLRPGAQTRSTNREIRNKHEWLNPARLETGSQAEVVIFDFEPSGFGFVSDFDIRISDFRPLAGLAAAQLFLEY